LNKYAIILAGGSGKRFGADVPKQFSLLAGTPLLMHAARAFVTAFHDIHLIMVVPGEHTGYWKELCDKHNFIYPHQVVNGGTERFYSVKNGLSLIKGGGLVAVHDGARPLVNVELIKNTFQIAEEKGCAVPAIEVSDSVRWIENNTNRPFPRDQIRLIQTPQVFEAQLILKAYQQSYNPRFTDDAGLVEACGHSLTLTMGDPENIKITTPIDLIIAEAILKSRMLKNGHYI
jgi:2-C-methyl-D-erythritol 4-phosphate cytidylyltransferase